MFGLNPWMLLGVVALLAASTTGAWFAGDANGADRVKLELAVADTKATAAASALAHERAGRADDAARSDAERDRLLTAALNPIRSELTRYVQTPAARALCLDDDGRLLVGKAVAAANDAIAGGAGTRGAAVPVAAGDR